MQNRKRKNQNHGKSRAERGIIKVNSRGIGYVKFPDWKEDLEIETYFLKTALNNDEVLVIPHPKVGWKRRQGEVVEILRRAKTRFVGTLEKSGLNYFLKPNDKRLYRDILIPEQFTKNATIGKKVLVRITSWGDVKKNPEGEVVEVLGEKGTHEVEMRSIVLEKGFEMDFPPEVVKEAEEVAVHSLKEIESNASERMDFRGVVTFTIDPEDAKDFDDAISIRKIGDNNYEIGIHIADVSHYVRKGGKLDKEAQNRGFSIYLVDRTIPMLPEILSNNLCSLNPNEDRLSFSAVFEMNAQGVISSRHFGKSIIRSRKRFSYEDAQKILDQGKGEFFDELETLNTFAKKFREDRFKAGAIDFDTDEVRFELDNEKNPIRIWKKARLDTHKLVEEFMLLANKEVAYFAFKKSKKPSGFIFRVHDAPNKDKIKELSIFLKALGYNLKIDPLGNVSSKDLNALFQKIEGKDEESLIKTAAVRSMAKAVYSTKNKGHFGLAFRDYTHFTSPIRRYPDLLVHRFIYTYLKGIAPPESPEVMESLALEMSEKEVRVSEAERDSIKYKQVEFMLPNVGKTFDGVISGITEWGIYVEEKETKAEGMVKLRYIDDDFYELNEKQYALVGRKTKRKLRLGDKVKVKVESVDLERKQIDYRLVR